MTSEVIVRSVFETNDCGGKKDFQITSAEHDEITASRFKLDRKYASPNHKLELATVIPDDRVVVELSIFQDQDPFVLGDYVHNLSNTFNRRAVCKCGHPLVSDGFEIYCLNPECGLTLLARIQRLANTQFFDFNTDMFVNFDYNEMVNGKEPEDITKVRDGDCLYPKDLEFLRGTEHDKYSRPFSMILQPRLWGDAVGSLENLLLTRRAIAINLATFLAEPLFRDFLDFVSPSINPSSHDFSYISNFFGCMTELTQRRDYDSSQQNRLIQAFIWSLGIQSLREDVISRMLTDEMSHGHTESPMISYLYLLSNPGVMIESLGVHHIEAMCIHREFTNRIYEMEDIFRPYISEAEVRDIFHRRV